MDTFLEIRADKGTKVTNVWGFIQQCAGDVLKNILKEQCDSDA